ncbi:MAG TPA: nitronate monooxygenase, partial [Myxococcota bacterium]|nr:nitronate monooxygenase [Myxococcota bacterium]
MSRDAALARQLLDLRVPVLQAPMFRVSSARLAAACSRAGMIGAFQLANPDSLVELEQWLGALAREEDASRSTGQGFAPYCVNVNASPSLRGDYSDRVALCERARVPLVLSSTGDPTALVPRVHAWGGRLIHDVTTLRFAEKAIAASADGLMLTCAGAGGHTGAL